MHYLTPQPTISINLTVAAAKGQIFADLADEVVILDIESGIHYGLHAVGTRTWHLIQAPRTVKDIQDTFKAGKEVRDG